LIRRPYGPSLTWLASDARPARQPACRSRSAGRRPAPTVCAMTG